MYVCGPNKYENVFINEFDSPDLKDSGRLMQHQALFFYDCLMNYLKMHIKPSSAFRTPKHNTSVKGVKNSAHLRGWAIDIPCNDSYLRWRILYFALTFGCTRIEVGKNWIHVDFDPTLPQKVVFLP